MGRVHRSADRGGTVGTPVSQAVAGEITTIGEVVRETLSYDAFLAGRSVVRLRGTAVVQGETVPWSLIEKVTEGPAVASPYLYDNAAREFAAYRSGLLDDLAPGVTAPRLLRAIEGEDGRLTLWLEDLDVRERRPISHPDVLVAARHLGRLGGSWLDRVPQHSWLFHGWIDRHVQRDAIPGGLAVLIATPARAGIEHRLGRSLREAIELVAAQPTYASALQQLPTTLCHHDAVAANVFLRDRDGTRQTVLVDWESVGPGAIGADLASLLFSSARRGDLSARSVRALLGDAIEAYARGVADVGTSIGPKDVPLGVHAAIALRWTLVRDVVRAIGGITDVRRGSAPDESPEHALDELIALVAVLLDSAAEARALLA